MYHENRNSQPASSATVALGLVAGSILGGVLALWLAPNLGRRSRDRLRDIVGDARECAAELRDRFEGVIHQGRTLVEANKAAIRSAYEAGREAFHRERERVRGAEPTSATSAIRSTTEGP